MPEAPLTPAEAHQLRDIDALYRPTHDELARQRFVSAVRKHVLVDKAAEMKAAYEREAKPAYRRRRGRDPKDLLEIRQAMLKNPTFQVFSALRLNAQELSWVSVMDPVERALPEMIEVAKTAARLNPAGGSVKTDPKFKPPGYVADIDVHHIPGSFTAELAPDDVAVGAVAHFGTKVFAGALPHRKDNPGDVAQSVAHYLKFKYPDFKPRRILDCGTTGGKNLAPYLDVYPEAELYGIDVAASALRYGHAQWEYRGKKIHFSQQNAEATNFPDGFFDLIVSSFFFHEMPVASTKKILRENHRLLAKGGRLAHMELPPNGMVDPYYAFYLDWDCYYNYEPDYADYRAQVPTKLCAQAGFDPKTCWQLIIPNWRTAGEDNFKRFVAGDIPPPQHGNGASWFIFGAEKT
ncbi:MAG: class I SAM-dependent methyltransferase [Rhodospirillaceae bacterium]|nr:class I SAM-dependent methyltransferase [Rhodospirillaceae bacterium]